MIRKCLSSFYFSLGCITAAKSLPHAILTVLLLSKGLSIAQILIIQAIFNAAVLCCEFPSGVISDLWHKKSVYLIANVVLLAMYVVVLVGVGFWWMAIAWGLYGVSEALNSGTLDAAIINMLKSDSSSDVQRVVTFKKRFNQIQVVAMIAGAAVGSFLYFRIGANIYMLGAVLIIIGIIPVAVFFPRESVATSPDASIVSQIRDSFAELKTDRRLKYLVVFAAVSQIFLQTHFNLWQAYVLLLGFSQKNLFWFYMLFQVIGLVAYSLPVKKGSAKLLPAVVVLAMLCPFGLLSSSPIFAMSMYCVSVFISMFAQYLCDVFFSLFISQERISTLLTLNSTVSRVAGLLVLGINSWMLNVVGLKSVLIGCFEVFVMVSIIGVFLFRVRATGDRTAREKIK